MGTDALDVIFGTRDRRRFRVGYRLRKLAGTYPREVAGTTARFTVETFREYRRIRTLMDERDVLEDVLAEVSADDVFYDVGANIGIYTCLVGQHATTTVAVEPHEPTADRLRENVAANDLDVAVFTTALSNTTGPAVLTHPERSPTALGSGEYSLVPDEEAVEMAETTAVRGDDLIRRADVPHPSIAKIDVEGAELEVIEGIERALADCRLLYVEVHRDHVEVDAVESALSAQGFTVRQFRERGNTTFLKARRPE